MSTNYYLVLPKKPCVTCGHDASTRIHMGKSSGGWVFLWHGYSADDNEGMPNLRNSTEWKLFSDENNYIVSEYAEHFSPGRFVRKVLELRTNKNSGPHTVTPEGDSISFNDFC